MKRLWPALIILAGAVGVASAQVPELRETREIRFGTLGQEVADRAAELGSVVAMYEFVLNECEYLPYYGVRSGSLNTLWRRGGNDVDLAALLIAMLRSQGVHARYVSGQIRVPDDALASWVGVATRAEAVEILKGSGVWLIDETQAGWVSLWHAWVEALVPVGNYRGLPRDGTPAACSAESNDCRWVSLDPSFKPHRVTAPTVDSLNDALTFDYARYHEAIAAPNDDAWRNRNPLDLLQQAILSARPGKSLNDVTGQLAIVPTEAGLLPASLPFEVVGAPTSWSRYASAAERDGLSLTDQTHCSIYAHAWTRCITFRFRGVAPGATGNVCNAGQCSLEAGVSCNSNDDCYPGARTVVTYQLPLDRLAGPQRPDLWASVSSASNSECGPTATACDLIAFRTPATNSLYQPAWVEPRPDEYYELHVLAEVFGPEILATAAVPPIYTTLERGSTYAFFAGGIESNAGLVADAADRFTERYADGRLLRDAAGTFVDVNANGVRDVPPDFTVQGENEAVADLLKLAGRLYAYRLTTAVGRTAALTQTRVNRPYVVGFTSALSSGTYVAGAPFSTSPTGMLIDATTVAATPYRFTAGTKVLQRDVAKMLDYTGSSLEHEVWQELTGFDAISTVRGFQKARNEGSALITTRTTADLPNLYSGTGWTATPTGFTQITVPLHDLYSAIAENPVVWLAPANAQTAWFAMLKASVDGSTAAPRTELVVHEPSRPIRWVTSAQQGQTFRDALPNGVQRFPEWTWAELVTCFQTELASVQGLANTAAVPDINVCLAKQFSGNVGQMRASIAAQWTHFKDVTKALRYSNSTDFARYVDTAAGFVSGDFRFQRLDTTPARPNPGIVHFIRNQLALRTPAVTSAEFIVPAAQVVENASTFDVFYSAVNTSEGREAFSYIGRNGVGGSGGYVVGDESIEDWTIDPTLLDETVEYDNAFHSDKVLNADSNNSPHSSHTGDPVSTATGNMFHDETDVRLAAHPFDIVFSRTYNSRPGRLLERFPNTNVERTYWPLGPGWTHSYAMMLITNSFGESPNADPSDGIMRSVTYIDERGGETNFLVTGGTCLCPGSPTPCQICTIASPPGFMGTLRPPNTDHPNVWWLEFPNGVRYTFRTRIPTQFPGGVALLETMEDADGNKLTIDFGADSGERTQTVKDSYGRTRLTLRHDKGRLYEVADYTNRKWTFAYDQASGLPQRLVSVTNPELQTTTYEYAVPFTTSVSPLSAFGALFRLTNILYPPRSNVGDLQRTMAFDYYTNGRAASTTDVLGNSERFQYNLFERSATITDPRGFPRVHVNDDRGALVSRVDQDGNVRRFSNQSDNLRYEKYDAKGRATKYSYRGDETFGTAADRAGNITREQDATGADAHYQYQSLATPSGRSVFQISQVTDKNARQRTFQYCPANTAGCPVGKLWRSNEPPLQTLAERSYFSDGTLSQLQERIDPTNASRKRLTDYVYDSEIAGSVTRRVRPDGRNVTGATSGGTLRWRYEYDDLKRLTADSLELGTSSPTHPVGVVRIKTSYGYDNLDRVTSVTRPDGSTVLTDYDEDGHPWRVRAQYSNGTFRTLVTRTYDVAGRLVKEIDTMGHPTEWTYDESGNVLTMTDANSHVTRYEYDAMGRRTRTIDANGNIVVTNYDANGDVRELITAAGTTSFQRDEVGRVLQTISPLFNRTAQRYDGSGNIIGVRDANVTSGARTGNSAGDSVTTDYDALGRVWKVHDADGNITTFEYDLLGNRTAVTDARGKKTSFAYNDLGQLVTITDPLLKSSTLTYDAAGNVATRTDRNGRLSKFYYDAANRLTGVDFNSNGTGLDEERHYDAFGNMDWIRNAAVTYTFTYDSLNRPTSRTDSRTRKQIAWDYDAVGNVIRRTGYEGDVTTFTYDSANRLVAMSNSDYLGAAYHYDEAGRLLDRIFSNGQRTVFGYDADSRLTETSQYDAAGTLLNRERYCLDNAGLLTTALRGSTGTCAAPAGDRTAYVYDDLYRLTDENVTASGVTTTATDLAYDAVGNVDTAAGDADGTFRDYVVDNANRLTELRSNTGTLLARFDYDFEGNRTAKRNAAGTVIESYTYDDKNRLISLTAGTQTTTYTYDPFDYRIGQKTGSDERLYLLDGEHVEGVYTATGLPLATYLRGAVIDELVGAYHYDTTGKRVFYAFGHDRLTSVARLASHTGATIQSYTYGPFGADRTGSGASLNRFKYTGREQDPTGFYYYRARYYDPSTRRFLTEDPMGFAAGVNFYVYAENNPARYADPTGQYVDTVLDVGFIAYDVYDLAVNPSWVGAGALGLDVVGALLPGATGLGSVYRASRFAPTKAFLREAASRAVRNVDTVGLSARNAGSRLHAFAEDFAAARRDFIIEQPYLNGQSIANRARGSSVPDVLTGTLDNPTAAFDFKFGSQGISPSWENRLRSNLPTGSAGIPVTEIRPYTPGQRVAGIGAVSAYAK